MNILGLRWGCLRQWATWFSNDAENWWNAYCCSSAGGQAAVVSILDEDHILARRYLVGDARVLAFGFT